MDNLERDPTAAEYLDYWLSEFASPSLRPRTVEGYRFVVRKHLVPSLGSQRLSSLSPTDVASMISAKRAEGLSARSLQHTQAVLRSALSTAERLELVTRNVARIAPPVRYRPPEAQFLSRSDLELFRAAMQGDQDEPLYALALATGMRLGELLGLEWRDIRFDRRDVTIRRAVQRYGGPLRVVATKDRRARVVALSELAITALTAQRRTRLSRVPGGRWDEYDFVFSSRAGGPLEPRNVLRRFQRFLSRAGIEKRRFHDLRHTCATMLLEAEVHHRVVMEILGHSSVSTTLDLYSHVSPELQREATRRLDRAWDLLDGTPPKANP